MSSPQKSINTLPSINNLTICINIMILFQISLSYPTLALCDFLYKRLVILLLTYLQSSLRNLQETNTE